MTQRRVLFMLTTLLLITSSGCNLFSAVDSPSSDPEKLQQAMALMDEGKCDEAYKIFDGRSNLTDDEYHTLGWAQMCASGAKFTNIAKSVFKFSTTTNDMTIIGAIANSLIPQNASRIVGITNAINSFSQIKNLQLRNVNLVIATLTKIAAIIATTSTNNSTVRQSDISTDATCSLPATCACAANATCLHDADADAIGTLISNLSTYASAAGVGSMGSVNDLINAINAIGANATIGYRYIVQQRFVAP